MWSRKMQIMQNIACQTYISILYIHQATKAPKSSTCPKMISLQKRKKLKKQAKNNTDNYSPRE